MFRPLSELNSPLTFSDYFKLNIDVDFILASFGYGYENILGELPRAMINEQRVGELTTRIEESLPYINLTNETARREFLIAPVLLEVVHYTKARVRVEFPLKVSDQLQG